MDLNVTITLAISASRQLTANLERVTVCLKVIETQLRDLETLGFVEARPSYRDGIYLYLIHPMVNGVRSREYIGNDPAKIIAALDRVARHKHYTELRHKQVLYASRFETLFFDLTHWTERIMIWLPS